MYSYLSIGNQSTDFEKFNYDTEIPWFSLNKCGVTKGSALLKMCEYLGINSSEVVAIGNDYNDVSMLNVCGSFICPTNSIGCVREKDSIKYDSNGGLGKVLKKIYEGNR